VIAFKAPMFDDLPQ